MYSEFYSGALGVGSRPECGPVPRYSVGTTLSIISLWIVYYVYAQCPSIYYVNRIVHAFTAAGVLPSQYKRMSTFSRMGNIGKNYINKGYCIDISFASIDCVVCLIVYTSLGYCTVVSEATEQYGSARGA